METNTPQSQVTSLALLTVTRGLFGGILLIWLKFPTALHSLTAGHGASLYPNLVRNLGLLTGAYSLGSLVTALGFLLLPRFPKAKQKGMTRRILIEQALTGFFLLDLLVLYLLQSSTAGPRSPFILGNFIVIALAAVTVRSNLVATIYLILTMSLYVIHYLDWSDGKSILDILIESLTMLVFFTSIRFLRNRSRGPGAEHTPAQEGNGG